MFKPFGYEPVLTREEIHQHKKKKSDKVSNMSSTLKRVWLLVDEQRIGLLIVFALVFISASLMLLAPFLIGLLIDRHIVPKELEGVGAIILTLVLIYALLSLTLFLQNYLMIGIAQQTVYRMRTLLFGKFQRLPVSFFDKKQHGDLMSRMTNDMDNVSTTLNTTFIEVFSSVLIIIGTAAVMLYLSPILTLMTMIIIPMMFFATTWITKRTGPLFKKQQATLGQLNGMVEETVSGQLVVKAYSQEQRMIEGFERQSFQLRKTGYWANIYSGAIPKVMNFLNNFSFALVAGVGGVLAYNGYVTIGTIVIFVEYSRQFTRPLNELANQFNNVLSAIAGAERVFELLDEDDEIEGHTLPLRTKLQGDIRFSHIDFKYNQEDEQQTIHDLSFHIPAGKTAAFIGATGAGKTTVMQLIARFYDYDRGSITIDGQELKTISRADLRAQMAFVLQDSFLFEASIYDNIRYGRLDATDEEIIEACKQANAHKFIEQLSNGYEHVLTAEAGDISQGQKQLLSIARALIANPAILLLDEATSSIDTVTELEIQKALDQLMVGRTSIVIAHRLNTVKKADILFVLQYGQIVEFGSPKELIAAKGQYYKMVTQTETSDLD
ncbi:ABC transporter ATP-binding protein [Kurthia sibirica]|uniref:Multidrug ABC transporter ATP-binding protein n=1 Tax=Kurthia sibirica TaxID=202750 RepID=A0A2U3APU6_9BACL|nr:ABC transporter ATP-binding protein [Kurthia sibirica]PWI26563.1 multidrug ABC transporter ATP-binding protein [Kurthia sibirica]GEK32813.1 putative ABC transporter ATP-binding protein YfiC [Kurthia sibirica]